ncbi:MAG: hypothetical protein JJU36_15080 [Phycisphaeraceae bacterium]|nr:hypothetical protein [Phycisphaeraceae bacterium]
MAAPSSRLVFGSATYLSFLTIALLFGGMWLAHHGQILPPFPETFASTVQSLAASLPILLIWWMGAAGWGSLIRGRLVRRSELGLVVSLALGASAQLGMFWMLGVLGLLSTLMAWGVCILGTLAAIRRLADRDRLAELRPVNWPSPPWTILLGIPVLGLALVATVCPPGTLWSVEARGYDVLLYHLQLPREWLAMGRIAGLEHNVYSFLPNLTESGFLSIMAMQGGGLGAMATCALLHLGFAVLTAAAISRVAQLWVTPVSAAVGGVLFLLVPWTIITGTLAYNEMVMLAMGVCALGLLIEESRPTRGRLVAVGMLLGMSILAKPSALALWVAPLLILVPWMLSGRESSSNEAGEPEPSTGWLMHRSSSRWVSTLVIVLVMGLTVSPWLVRNTVWTWPDGRPDRGAVNPVFPLGIGVFGRAHWSPEQAERWNRAHHSPRPPVEIGHRLARDGLFSAGFGALGGRPVTDADEVARFDREWGIPLVLMLAILGGVAMVRRGGRVRVVALRLGAMAVLQIIAWALLTHHQGRFLVVLLPAVCIAVAIGSQALLERLTAMRWAFVFFAVVIALSLSVHLLSLMHRQTLRLFDPATRQWLHAAPGQIIDSPEWIRHPLDTRVGPNAITLIIADNQGLAHIQSRVIYATAWDEDPLAARLRALERDGIDDPRQIAGALRQEGITHVWFGWGELRRLVGSYGYDPGIEEAALIEMFQRGGWRPVESYPERGAILLAIVP